MTNASAASFEAFLQGWVVRQRNYHRELVSAQENSHNMQDDDKKELINRVLSHYEEYFVEKSKVAHDDVFILFSPPWFSSLERAYLWVAGFKPGLALQVLETSLLDLSEEQKRRLNLIKQETKVKERNINDALARFQESMAEAPLAEMVRSYGRVCVERSFTAGEGATIPQGLKGRLEDLVADADALRGDVALEVLQTLKPDQAMKFLAEMTDLQLRIRDWGWEKDTQGRP